MLMPFCNSLFGISYNLLMPSLPEKWLMVGAERVGWPLAAAGAGAIVGNWILASLPPRVHIDFLSMMPTKS